jgi:hypothetical protein
MPCCPCQCWIGIKGCDHPGLKASAWEIQDKKMAIGSLVHEAVSFIVFRYIVMLPEGSAVSYPLNAVNLVDYLK